MSKTALVVAPHYEGTQLPAVPGGDEIVLRAEQILRDHGGYDVKVLAGSVSRAELNREMSLLARSRGSILFLFFGHGVTRGNQGCYLATSDSRDFDEGVSSEEAVSLMFHSDAREAIVVLDCCHAGAAYPAEAATIWPRGDRPLGRALFAACAGQQLAWADSIYADKPGGVFSNLLLDGLGGAAERGGKVRASTLCDFAGHHLAQWAQSPILLSSEGGDCFCTITEGFDNPPRSGRKAKSGLFRRSVRRLGLPFRPSAGFVGRDAEIDQLLTLVTGDGGKISISATIEGIGGIGKTELVIQFLNRPELDETFDVILWIDAAGPITPQIHALSAELGQDLSAIPDDQLGLRFDALLSRKGNCLVVVDNAFDWQPICRLMPVQAALLVTTRTQGFGGREFQHIELDGLGAAAAKALLLLYAPKLESDLDLDRLVAEQVGHALAIELAGATIQALDLSAADYLDGRRSIPDGSSSVLRQLRYGKTVEQAMALTWDSLSSEHAKALWRRATLFAPTIATRALLMESFSGPNLRGHRDRYNDVDGPYFTEAEFDKAYEELKARNVFTRVQGAGSAQWSLHRLVREFGRDRVTSDEYRAHTFALSEWLERRGPGPRPEMTLAGPHLIATMLDGVKYGYEEFRGRSAHREIGFRSGIFRSGALVHYLRDQMQDPGVLKMLFEGLTDVNPDVRAEAVKMLSSAADIEEIRAGIATALSDASPSVRRLATRALLEHRDALTADIISRVARLGPPQARAEAIRLLGEFGEAEARTTLGEILQSSTGQERLLAAIGLARSDDPRGADVLETASRVEKDDELRQSAALALWRVAPERARLVLSDAVSAADADSTVALLAMLSEIRYEGGTDLQISAEALCSVAPVIEKLLESKPMMAAILKNDEALSTVMMASHLVGIVIPEETCRLISKSRSQTIHLVVRHLTEANSRFAKPLLDAVVRDGGGDFQAIAKLCLLRNLGTDELLRLVNLGLAKRNDADQIAAIEIAGCQTDHRFANALRNRAADPDRALMPPLRDAINVAIALIEQP